MLLVGCSPTSPTTLSSAEDGGAPSDPPSTDARVADPADAPPSERPPVDAPAAVDAPAVDARPGLDAPPAVDAPGDPTCACTAPPRCVDSVTLEVSIATTACADNSCGIATSTSVCPFGCNAGACRVQACVPSCPVLACGSDGCGGSCGACDPGTTYPGIAPIELGTASALVAAGDGIHVATVRQFEAACAGQAPSIGRMDAWTVPVTGAAAHRTIGAHVLQSSILYSAANDLLYLDNAACDGHGELWIARADGTGARRIAINAGAFQAAGTTVVYESRSDSALYAVQLPISVPIKIASGGGHFLDQLIFGISPDGTAVWAYTTGVTELRLARTDGSGQNTLVAPPDQPAGAPLWSADGRRVAFRWVDDAPPFAVPFEVVNRDGTGRTQLTLTGSSNPYVSGAFAADGRLAYIDSVSANLDVVIRSFTGAPSVRIAAVGSPSSPGVINTLQFSNDGARLYATVNDANKRVSNLMVGRTDVGGDAQLFSAGGGGWSEALDSSAVAVAGVYNTSSTSVITLGGSTATLLGAPLYVPAYEPVASHPRLLVSSGSALLAYPTAGSGPGSPLAGFMATGDLNGWTSLHNVPFVFGWARSLALYPSAVRSTPSQVSFDLMGWSSDTVRGRLLAGASRYQVGRGRIFATTDGGRLFVIPTP